MAQDTQATNATQAAQTLTTLVLGGHLPRKFKGRREWQFYLNIPSPAEAFRALDVNTGGEFRRYMKAQGNERFYRVSIGRKGNDLDERELCNPSGGQTIYLLPVIKGREKAGTKILAAVAIAVITYFTAGAGSAGAAGMFGSSASAVATAGYGAAASLALGGITQLLTPNPNFNSSTSADDGKGSNIFQGNSTAVAQGGAVPLVYGRALVRPMPISVAFTAEDQAIMNSFALQTYTVVHGEGGIIDYRADPPDPRDNLP